MSKTGPPQSPLAERLREREKQETEWYNDFLRRTRLQIDTELESLTETVAAKYRQAATRLAKMHDEQVETWMWSLNAERARIENSYRSGWDLLRRWWLRIFLILALMSSGIYLSVSGLTRWDATHIQRRTERIQEELEGEINRLNRDLHNLQKTVDVLYGQSWGIRLTEYENGIRHVYLPIGSWTSKARNGRIIAVLPPAPTE